MKTIHSIILGILLIFTVYAFFLMLQEKDDIHILTFNYLMLTSFSWWQLGQIVKYRNLYIQEKHKNDMLIDGISETKTLINKALVNKN